MVVELINKSLIDALIVVLFLPVVCYGENRFINEIPDFTQTDVKEKNSGNGQQYCAPVAVANSIAWMSGTENKQLRLITRLASTNYMNTSLKNGTGTSGVLRGVDKISRELFGGFKTLIYQGWRKHPKSYSSGKIVPDISKLKSAVTRKSAAWLNIGWYKYNKQSNEYRRYGGHWVTLVGALDDQLILHDPAPRAGAMFSNEYVRYSEIENGILVGKKSGLPVSAKGFIALGEGFHLKSGADYAILDGVVYFEI